MKIHIDVIVKKCHLDTIVGWVNGFELLFLQDSSAINYCKCK